MRPNSSRLFSLTQYAIIAPIIAPNTEASLSSASYRAPAIELKRERSDNEQARRENRQGGGWHNVLSPETQIIRQGPSQFVPQTHIPDSTNLLFSLFSLFPSSVTWPRGPRCAASSRL
jgi:hypothetical protein